jgi:hypothetical protein
MADSTTSIEWRPCASLPGYEVTADGQVRIGRRFFHGCAKGTPFVGRVPSKIIRQYEKRDGDRPVAMMVRAKYDRKVAVRYVHRLVLEAFVGPCPDGMEGCHFDGNFRNNRVGNLRWDTRKGNMADARRHGTIRIPGLRGEGHPLSRFTEEDVLDMRRRFAAGESQGQIAKLYATGQPVVQAIVRRKTWTHI